LLKLASVPLWRQILRTNFTNLTHLLNYLELDPQPAKDISNPRFVLNLPLRLAQKIKKKTWDDPILKQFLPTADENIQLEGFDQDPVGDHACQKSTKLLHKYHGRALLVCTSACAMHCRYCFRQNYPYDQEIKGFRQEIDLIRQDTSIKEVILSGGDPLSLSDQTLETLLLNLYSIPHLKMIRFHTRFPIGIPERIDAGFLKLLSQSPLQIWFVIHANHPLELDNDVLQAMRNLQKQGITILNQSVLLKGVNDDVKVLKELSERLVANGIVPYYLHQLDRVQGASSFEVTEEKGCQIIQELTKLLPGYAVPKYVREIAGQPSKTALLI
jgi:EF-P beta-lysylation protein EpmB